MQGRSVLLGGLGGDSHSVGLNILRRAAQARGFELVYIGTQNTIEDFWAYAASVNAVLVSCMDGHARTYLRDFAALKMRSIEQHQPVWLLGGNPSVEKLVGGERHFLEMGFDYVYLGFIEVEAVMDALERAVAPLAPRTPPEMQPFGTKRRAGEWHAVTSGKMPLPDLEAERVRVLSSWRTGAGAADLEANATALKASHNWTALQAKVNNGERRALVQPRSGVPSDQEQLELFQAFKRFGADILSFQVDSYTRNNNYAAAEDAIRESAQLGISTINGFPVVNHGVEVVRRIARTIGVPLQTRHSTRDPRLLAEISYGGGLTAYEGGPICYNIPYYKDYPVAEAIQRWRYVDRLTGHYAERYGQIIDREFFGTLTATLIPPCLAIGTGILESILAAEQGVKAVSIGWAEQGHRIQDVAAIRSIIPLAREVLGNLGFGDVAVSSVFHQYMAAFPSLEVKAEELIFESSVTAALSGATRIINKTPVEAYKIPSLADNLRGLVLTQRGIADAARIAVDEAAVAAEMALIRRETLALIEAVVTLGRGDIAQGIVAGFQTGALDIPFAPSVHSRGDAMCARDIDGAIRFLSVGKLPFDSETRQFHKEAIQERRRAEGITERDDFKLIERDVMRVATAQYERWPLGGDKSFVPTAVKSLGR